MNLWLNGKEHQTEAATLAALVAELGLPARAILIEKNGVALRRDEWGRELREGDRLEVVRIVAGG